MKTAEMTKEQKQKLIVIETREALYRLKKIYQDFDQLNGNLHELSEMLDKHEYAWFHDFWMRFPTYNELDDLDQFLTNLKNENKE